MDSIKVQGFIDDEHRLSAEVPSSVSPGPVTIWISATPAEDDSATAWTNGIAREWADELADERQDIYTLADGEPVDPA